MRVERPASVTRCRLRLIVLAIVALILSPGIARSQGLHGVLIGVVNDEQGGVLAGARITLSSPALIGGPLTLLTNDRGQLRFVALPPGLYSIRIELQGFLPYTEGDLRIGPGATTETSPVLRMAGQAESIVVRGERSHLEARNPGFGTLFGEELQQIPARRAGMFDAIRFAPGISPTSPSSGMVTTISAFGSGTNENHFLFDGTNFTCPCSGIARAEPGTDFIQEVHVQSVGASAEYGNMQGAVINVITRQGSERFLFDAAYYAQTDRLTSHPVELAYIGSGGGVSTYRRRRLRDATMNLGGPAIRDRLWFFAGYQALRDLDSQPGTDPAFPRQYEQDKVFGKLTWKLGAALRLEQSFHGEFGLNPERPTIVTPFEAIARREVSVPATTFGHLTHAASANTLWDVRVGRFVYSQDDSSPDGSTTTPSRLDRTSGVTSGAPPRIGSIRIMRTTAKGTLSRYLSGLPGADHQLKIGGQLERGEHDSQAVIPTGDTQTIRNDLVSRCRHRTQMAPALAALSALHELLPSVAQEVRLKVQDNLRRTALTA